jgi:hypothetical protein
MPVGSTDKEILGKVPALKAEVDQLSAQLDQVSHTVQSLQDYFQLCRSSFDRSGIFMPAADLLSRKPDGLGLSPSQQRANYYPRSGSIN